MLIDKSRKLSHMQERREQQPKKTTIHEIIKSSLAGNLRREQLRVISQPAIDSFDFKIPESLGLKINSEALASLAPNEKSEISSQIAELNSELPQLTESQIFAAWREAMGMDQVGDVTISNSEAEKNPSFRRVTQILARLLLAGFISTGLGSVAKEASAQSSLPTITPTATETKLPTATETPTPRSTPVPTATPTPEVIATPETVTVTYAVCKSDTPVNVRESTSTSSEKITTLVPGEKLPIILEDTVTVDGFDWYRVVVVEDKDLTDNSDDTVYGFVRSDVVDTVMEEKKVEPIATPTSAITPELETSDEPKSTTVVTDTESITSTEGVGGDISLETLTEQAQSFNAEVTSVRIGLNNPVGLDQTGFPIIEYKNGAWQEVKLLSMSEVLQNTEINGEKLFEGMPTQAAYALEDGTVELKKLSTPDINKALLSITDLGIYTSLPLVENQNLVMKWSELEYRSGWEIPQFQGELIEVNLSGYFNEEYPNRKIDNARQYVLEIVNGSPEEALKGEERRSIYVDNLDNVEWAKANDIRLLPESAKAEIAPAGYDNSIKIDKLGTAFYELLSPNIKEGKLLIPSLNKSVDVSKPIQFTVHRFADRGTESANEKLGYYQDVAFGILPEGFYQVDENGVLHIHVTTIETDSNHISVTAARAFTELALAEFKLPVDWYDIKTPKISQLDYALYDYVKFKNEGTDHTVLVSPMFVTAAYEGEMTAIPMR